MSRTHPRSSWQPKSVFGLRLFRIVSLVAMTSAIAWSQGVGIGESSFAPDPSAILELRHTGGPFKGFLTPRMTTAERTSIASPANGLLVYDTDLRSFLYNDAGWVALPGGNSVLGIANGGTGQTTALAGFDALSPMTTIGDLIYGGALGSALRLSGNTSTQRMALTQQGDGVDAGAPVWVPLGHSGVTVYESGSGAYNVPADVTVLVVEIVGGGGGGAGGTATQNGRSAVGSGGGGGAYARKRLDVTPGASFAYTVGVGGAGSSTAPGTDGGQTQFGAVTASGGVGGTNMDNGNSVLAISGGSGGPAGNSGDVDVEGGSGGGSYRMSGTLGISGRGGVSRYGSGGPTVFCMGNAVSNGSDGIGYGGGGGGGSAQRAAAPNKTATGGNGAEGVIIIWEYK